MVTNSNINNNSLTQEALPHNIEAEQSLLGTLLYNNIAYEQVSDFLKTEHFCDANHGKIYNAIAKLIEKGQVADPITLRDYFKSQKELEQIGGTDYLATLATSVVSLVNTKDYGQLIHDLHLRRQLINIGHDLSTKSHKVDLDSKASDHIEETEQKTV